MPPGAGFFVNGLDKTIQQSMREMRSFNAKYVGVAADAAESLFTGPNPLPVNEMSIKEIQDAVKARVRPRLDPAHAGRLPIQGSDGKLRYYDPESWSETVARTRSRDLQEAGLHNEMAKAGMDLVIVAVGRVRHEACSLWEGRILSVSGKTPGYPTIFEAKRTGLFHPRCVHTTSPVILSNDEAGPQIWGRDSLPKVASREIQKASTWASRPVRGRGKTQVAGPPPEQLTPWQKLRKGIIESGDVPEELKGKGILTFDGVEPKMTFDVDKAFRANDVLTSDEAFNKIFGAMGRISLRNNVRIVWEGVDDKFINTFMPRAFIKNRTLPRIETQANKFVRKFNAGGRTAKLGEELRDQFEAWFEGDYAARRRLLGLPADPADRQLFEIQLELLKPDRAKVAAYLSRAEVNKLVDDRALAALNKLDPNELRIANPTLSRGLRTWGGSSRAYRQLETLLEERPELMAGYRGPNQPLSPDLQNALSGKFIEPHNIEELRLMRAAVVRGKKYRGPAARGDQTRFFDLDVGEEYVLDNISSWSSGSSPVGGWNSSKTVFIVKNSSQGVDIRKFTGHTEREILMPRGVTYNVLERHDDRFGNVRYVLEETGIDPDKPVTQAGVRKPKGEPGPAPTPTQITAAAKKQAANTKPASNAAAPPGSLNALHDLMNKPIYDSDVKSATVDSWLSDKPLGQALAQTNQPSKTWHATEGALKAAFDAGIPVDLNQYDAANWKTMFQDFFQAGGPGSALVKEEKIVILKMMLGVFD